MGDSVEREGTILKGGNICPNTCLKNKMPRGNTCPNF